MHLWYHTCGFCVKCIWTRINFHEWYIFLCSYIFCSLRQFCVDTDIPYCASGTTLLRWKHKIDMFYMFYMLNTYMNIYFKCQFSISSLLSIHWFSNNLQWLLISKVEVSNGESSLAVIFSKLSVSTEKKLFLVLLSNI